jgi:hypothetical protein
MAASRRFGGASSDPPTQRHPSRPASGLRRFVARAGEGVDRLPRPDRQLGEEVRGRPEAVEAEAADGASLAAFVQAR